MTTLRTGADWPLLASGLGLIAVCYGFARFAYGLFVPAFRSAFDLTDTLLGAIGAGSYAGYCSAIAVSAVAVPRYGARRVAVSAGLVATAGMLLVAVTHSGTVLAVGVLVAGASTGIASPPLAAAIRQAVPLRRQDRAQAIVNAGTGAGVAVSGPVALLATGNWRLAWLAFATVAAALTWWVARTVPGPAPRPPSRPMVPRRWTAELAGIVADRRSWLLAAGAALFGITSSGVWTFGRDHLAGAAGLGEFASALVWIALGVAGLVGVVAGDLGRRWGLRHVWIGGIGLLAASSAGVGLFGSSLPAAAAALTVFGGTYIVLTAVILLWAVHLFPDGTAAAVAFGFLLLALGQALSAPAVGWVVDHAGTSVALMACAAVGVVAAAAAPRTRRRPEPAATEPRQSPASLEP